MSKRLYVAPLFGFEPEVYTILNETQNYLVGYTPGFNREISLNKNEDRIYAFSEDEYWEKQVDKLKQLISSYEDLIKIARERIELFKKAIGDSE